MNDYKIILSLQKLEKALVSLEVIVKKPDDPDRSNIDATIQRFEFTFELFWKLLKVILEFQGTETQYPRDTLRAAYRGRLINDEEGWLLMLKDRNLTSHTYDEAIADEIYRKIKEYVPIFRDTFNVLHERFIEKDEETNDVEF